MLLTDIGVKTGLQAGSFCCLNWYRALDRLDRKKDDWSGARFIDPSTSIIIPSLDYLTSLIHREEEMVYSAAGIKTPASLTGGSI
jgi:hypothetical protein